MKNLWSEILVPAVIAGLTVLGTVGVESARTVRPGTRVRLLREVRLDTLRRDTVPQDTGKKAAAVKKDTVLKDLSDDDFDFDKVQKEGQLKKIKNADGTSVIELKIDPFNEKESGMQFAYKRTHYLRIGARAYGDENTSKRYNFSPVFKVSSDFSKVEEVTNWDED